MRRPIAISIMPNYEKDDYKCAFKLLLKPGIWKTGDSQKKLSEWFINYFKVTNVFFFNSGRTALYSILKSYGIGKGDEVIIQGFTCVAVPDPVLWNNAKPVYADIDQSLNINPDSLLKFITAKTRAIIVQHTFGIPAQIKLLKKIADKHKILLIEDCAHSLGARFEGNKIGTYGDAAFFSFGRDKVISSVFGGAVIFNAKNENVLKRMQNISNSMPEMNTGWILKQIFYPLFFILIMPLYDIYIGKIILYLLIKLNLLDKPVEGPELAGATPSFFPGLLPNAMAALALNQIKKLDKLNRRREHIAFNYFEKLKNLGFVALPEKTNGAIYLRFNIRIQNKKHLFKYFKSQKILLGNWYSNIIDPIGVNYSKLGYLPGALPYAEKASAESLNLPTYPLLTDSAVDKIINLLEAYGDKRNSQ